MFIRNYLDRKEFMLISLLSKSDSGASKYKMQIYYILKLLFIIYLLVIYYLFTLCI